MTGYWTSDEVRPKRTVTQERDLLKRENAKLTKQVAALKEEIAALKKILG